MRECVSEPPSPCSAAAIKNKNHNAHSLLLCLPPLPNTHTPELNHVRYELSAAGFSFIVHPSAFSVYVPVANPGAPGGAVKGGNAGNKDGDGVNRPSHKGPSLDLRFEAGWSCWRPFVERVAFKNKRNGNNNNAISVNGQDSDGRGSKGGNVAGGTHVSEPCWVSKEVWPTVNKVQGDTCATLSALKV